MKSKEYKKIDIHCPHFGKCSGCKRDEDIIALPQYFEAQKYFTALGVENFRLSTGDPIHWRTRAKLAVRGDFSDPQIGLFAEGSHDVINIPLCKVHHPSINSAVESIRGWIVNHRIDPYNEKTRVGLLRYLQLAVERSTGRVQLVLVLNIREDAWNGSAPAILKFKEQLNTFWVEQEASIHSIWINFNPGQDNTILSPRWLHFRGGDWLVETICETEICFHPGSFAQANLEMFERLVVRMKDFIPIGSDLLEYYAGVGAIGLIMAGNSKKVRCVEIVPLAKKCFEESLRRLPVHYQSKISFISGAAGAAIDLLKSGSDIVVVDPPRKGLEPSMLRALCENKSYKRLIYMSCGWESFRENSEQLIAAGLKLVHAESFLFFPGGEHLETLAVYDVVCSDNSRCFDAV